MRRIGPGDMFSLKIGYRIRLKDNSEILLTSDYIQEALSYAYDKVYTIDGVEKITESGMISCRTLMGSYIV